MKIERLDLKGFGKFKDFSLEFNEAFNIVYGENESGKSTIQSFIKAMFYSLKGGRSLKDGLTNPKKRYKPWCDSAYKGSIKYVLDNGEGYTVERNFDSGETRVYDSLYTDITKTFDQLKDKGPLFAIKHMGLTEKCFEKTCFIGQMSTRFNAGESKEVLERLSNISETGFEEVSFKTAHDAIKEALKNYVGTDKTSTRPLDVINSKLKELNIRKESLIEGREAQFSIESEIMSLKEVINSLIQEKSVLMLSKEIIKLREDLEANNRLKKDLSQLASEISELKKESRRDEIEALLENSEGPNGSDNRNALFNIAIAVILIFITGTLIYGISKDKTAIAAIGVGVSAILLSVLLILKSNNNKLSKSLMKELELKNSKVAQMLILDIDKRINGLYGKVQALCEKKVNNEVELSEIISDFDKRIKDLYGGIDIYANRIKSMCQSSRLNNISYDKLMDIVMDLGTYAAREQVDELIQRVSDRMNEVQLLLKEKQMVLKKFEEDSYELEQLEENIRELELNKEKLEDTAFSLRTALDVLEEANQEIKRDFTPLLNSNASKIISKITASRYGELKADELLILRTTEPESRDIVPVSILSGGTIDQMYLALRIALVQTIEGKVEKLPLIMDEVLSQYDDARSLETLRMLMELSKERQIILFTCKKRELELARLVCNNNLNIIELL